MLHLSYVDMDDTVDLISSYSRFYALPLTEQIVAAITSDFAALDVPDLVQAHLGNNPRYFGGIDKTLSGFVVLDDEGDNYTLLDLRGGGQVWWQDHETRRVEPRFASLADYRAFRARRWEKELELDELDDWDVGDDREDAEAALLHEYAWTPSPQDFVSADLLTRYQWLMQALSQPACDNQGLPLQGPDALGAEAFNHYLSTFPTKEDEQREFETALPLMRGDVHLAIYWLLHTRLLGQDARLAQVLEQVAGVEAPLLRAFVDTFGAMADDADLPVVPDFRHRRARMLVWAQIDTKAPVAQRLRALAVSPRSVGAMVLGHIDSALQRDPDALDPTTTLQALDRISDTDAPATWALRARMQLRLGQDAGAAADTATRLLAASTTVDWQVITILLNPIHQAIGDGRALLAVVQPLLAWDDLMLRVLDLAEHAQRLLGDEEPSLSAEALAHNRRLAEDLLTIWDAPSFAEGIAQAAPATRDAMAMRLARRPDLADDDDERRWAIRHLLDSTLPTRIALVQRALPQLSGALQTSLLPELCRSVTDAGNALAPMLVAMIGEPSAGDYLAELDADDRVDAILAGLQSFWGDARLFEPLMALLQDAPVKSVLTDRVGEAIKRLREALDTAQRQRLFHWALARVQARATALAPDGSDDYPAKRVLEAMTSADMAATIRTALEDASAAMQRGEQAHKEVLDMLYGCLGDMSPQASGNTAYLFSRLWDEKSFPRGLCLAVHKCWTPALHGQILERLREQPSIAAAALYCASHGWESRHSETLDVAELVLAWPLPEDAAQRGLLKYVLLKGCVAALSLKKYAQVRSLYPPASAIDATAYTVGAHTTTVFDPFADSDLQAKLRNALDGKGEQQQTALLSRLQKARGKGVPVTGLALKALGELAGADAAFLWFSHPDTGATLFQDVRGDVHYFDGYGLATPPFEVHAEQSIGPDVFHDAVDVSARLTVWRGEALYDWTRLGAAISAVHGKAGLGQVRIAIRCATADDAARLLDSIAAHPPQGFVASDPWYRPGHGAIARSLADPRRKNLHSLGLRYNAWYDPSDTCLVGTHAIAAIDALEADARRAGGYTCSIEYLDVDKRPQDLSLLEGFEYLRRQQADTLAQAVSQTLEGLAGYLDAHALQPAAGALEARCDGPAAQADIAALAQACEHPLPDALVALWQQHASIGWRYPGQGMRLLSPAEVLAATPVAARQPLVVDAHGAPQWLLGDTDAVSRQIVPAHIDDGEGQGDSSADATLRQALVDTLLDALTRDIADVDLLWHGQRGDTRIERLQLGNARNLTTLRLDRDAAILAIRKGPRSYKGDVSFKHFDTLAAAEAAWAKARATAESAGQVPELAS